MGIIRVRDYELEPTQWSVDLYQILRSGEKSKNPGREYRKVVGYFTNYESAGRRLLELLQNRSEAADLKALIEATEAAKKEIVEAWNDRA